MKEYPTEMGYDPEAFEQYMLVYNGIKPLELG